MSNNKSKRLDPGKIAVSSLALFAMFVGAGNLIFPPELGQMAGSNHLLAFIAFALSAVGLVLMAVISTIRAGGTIDSVAKTLGPVLSMIFGGLIIVCIGPGLATPRTAATTYEVIQGAGFQNLHAWPVSIVFFLLSLVFALRPSNVVQNLGKILTPALVALLLVLIIKSFVTPLPIVNTGMEGVFAYSFESGYQTMDAFAAMAFAVVIIDGYKSMGMKDKKEIDRYTSFSAIFAALGLCILYGGLVYAGAQTSAEGLEGLTRVELLLHIVKNLLGQGGVIILMIVMSLACLTTSIGLITTFSNFFERVTKGKVPYTVWAIISAVWSCIFSVSGVESIVQFSAPILSILYPISICLIFLNFFPNHFKDPFIYYGALLGAFFPGIEYIVGLFGPEEIFAGIRQIFPQAFQSFYWIPLAFIGGLIFHLLHSLSQGKAEAKFEE